MSPKTLGALASLLGLTAFLPPDDPAFLAGFESDADAVDASSSSVSCLSAVCGAKELKTEPELKKEDSRTGDGMARGESAPAGVGSSTSLCQPPSALAAMRAQGRESGRNSSPPMAPAAMCNRVTTTTSSSSTSSSSWSSSRTQTPSRSAATTKPVPTNLNANALSSTSSTLAPQDFIESKPLPNFLKRERVPDLSPQTLQTLTRLLLARIGTFYTLHPTRARRFGLRWFGPIVRWVVRKLGKQLRYQAAMIPDSVSSELNAHAQEDDSATEGPGPHIFSPRKTPRKSPRKKAAAAVHMEKLLEAFEDLALTHTATTTTTTTKAGALPTENLTTQKKNSKSAIRFMSAAWLDRRGDDLDADNADINLAAAAAAATAFSEDDTGSGSSDMKFSSSDEDSGSDMEISDEESEFDGDVDGDGGREEESDHDSDAAVEALGAGIQRLGLDEAAPGSGSPSSHDDDRGTTHSTSASASISHGAVKTNPSVTLDEGAKKEKEEKDSLERLDLEDSESGEDMEFSSSDADEDRKKSSSQCAPSSPNPVLPRIRCKRMHMRVPAQDFVKA
ncbi:hypothetical protein DXG03_006784 [Asterophora parasitica]|uniref:Uncharacterized protein n=1 Tax=Asterophora parasitica TaxID=117018 RepID=A0A9P7GD71_9AGAR|nr:hypothetical protein DXG03_006784 [Asterophora parasitica]